MRLLRYEVIATPPAGGERVTDEFELRQVAYEHAARLRGQGWRDVECGPVLEIEPEDDRRGAAQLDLTR